MIEITIKNIPLIFETNPSNFSPQYIDKGTLAMLSEVEFTSDDKVLDLGCGYGVVGILAASFIKPENVVMSDIDDISLQMAEHNIELNKLSGIKVIKSDGFINIKESDFTLVLSNPPYHSDFSIAKHFIEKGFNRLKQGGKMYMVTKRRDWYKNKFVSVFGGVKISETNGYFIFMAEKKSMTYASKSKRGEK